MAGNVEQLEREQAALVNEAEAAPKRPTIQTETIWVVNMPRRYGDPHVRVFHERPKMNVVRDMSTVPATFKQTWPNGIKNACEEFLQVTRLKLKPHVIYEVKIEATADPTPTYPTDYKNNDGDGSEQED